MARRNRKETGSENEAERRIAEAARDRSVGLDLGSLDLKTLPDSITKLSNLQTLDLSNNQLSSLPDSIAKLSNLQELILAVNQLSSLPDSITKLSNLQWLNLGTNQLSSLPDSVTKLSNLRWLNLHINKLSSLPDSISKLSKLEELNLAGNQLSSLPDSITKLSNLLRLYVGVNQLSSLPDSISKLSKLRWLSLVKNQLSSLPDSVTKLSNLLQLDLGVNQLRSLPDSITKLSKLQTLDLSDNGLRSLPDSVTKFSNLLRLELGDNQLRSLPDSISKLSKLQWLDLSNNQLISLPESLLRIRNLRVLYLHGNPILGIPAELLGATYYDHMMNNETLANPAEILGYYFRSRQGHPLNEAKLILVGRGEVGKTSLVRRLVHNTFEPELKKTEGIQITAWDINLNSRENIRLNVWDFGGQEIMHATHQFFLTQRSLYLLVLNGRQGGEDADADYWLRLIESFGGGSPVIVVLNKIKQHRFDVNRRALEQKFTGVREFVETDCEKGTGIETLHSAIERETDRLQDLRVNFPASWGSIKERLAAMKENYLDFTTYRDECAQLGENDEDAQEKLAGYLHSLGIALNFRDDPRLQDTHVLNPHWVTNGIYKILNDQKLVQQKGELARDDLRRILDRNEYPAEMHGFLLDLMRKFELCFPIGDGAEERFLVPELLDKQEPGDTKAFLPEECLNFEYHYPVLPEGLIPRFIVRSYAMSARSPRWHSGVILGFEGNKALVKGDPQDRKVSISVSGPLATRRNILSIIRTDLERIHTSIAKLEAKAMVPVPDHPDVLIDFRKLLTFEEKGISQIQEVVGNDVLTLDIRKLLNGTDVAPRQRKEISIGEKPQGAKLFISYSHKDEDLRAELDAHIKLMQRTGLIETWNDRLIKPGDEWKGEIDQNLEAADIVLLLVSADFIASDFCWDKEMIRALDRHDAGEARVIPIIVRDCDWREAKFAKLQALPKDGTAIALWANRDSAWRDVAEGIKKAAQEILAARQRKG